VRDLDLVLARYLEGTASEAEVARLDDLLQKDPAVSRALFLAADQEESLRQLAGGVAAPAAGKASRSRLRPRGSRSAAPLLALAIALLGLAAILVVRGHPASEPAPGLPAPSPIVAPPAVPPPLPPTPSSPTPPTPPLVPEVPGEAPEPPALPPEPAPVAPAPPSLPPDPERPIASQPPEEAPRTLTTSLPIVAIEGALEAKGATGWRPVREAVAWASGTPIRAPRGNARFALADGTRISLREKTEVSLASAAPPVVSLASGEVYCEVPRTPGRRFAVRTAEAEARVTGTELAVARAGKTTVSVIEGSVEVSNARGKVTLAAGQTSEVGGGTPSTPRAFDAGRLGWRFELDAQAAALPRGAQVLLRKELGLGSTPTKERGDDFFAEVLAPREAAGVAIGKNTYLRFRYLAERFTPKQHFKISLKPLDETNYGGFLLGLVADRWETVTVRLTGTVYVNDRTRTLGPGETIHQIVWLARSEGAPVPAGARFSIGEVVVFEAPGAIASERLRPDPK
jgi:ferric-dicitrate binding protein FerR (iron transport regulator)